MTLSYSNPFFLIGFGADRILYRFGCEYGFFYVGNGTGLDRCRSRSGLFKSDNICLHIIFYYEKQSINQSHKPII